MNLSYNNKNNIKNVDRLREASFLTAKDKTPSLWYAYKVG